MQTSTSELLRKSVRLQKYWSTFPLVLISWQYSYSVMATFTTFIKNPPCLWSNYRPWPISFKPQTCDAVLNTLVNFKGLWNKWKTQGYKRIRDEMNSLHHYAHPNSCLTQTHWPASWRDGLLSNLWEHRAGWIAWGLPWSPAGLGRD